MQNEIKNLSGQEYLRRLKENPVVIIPTGACEIYGPHLPLGTDFLVAKKMSELLADKINALIAPSIEVGESAALASFSSTFAMPRKILEDYLDFLVNKLIDDGAKKLIFITGHAGNIDSVNYILKKYQHKDFKAFQIDWWRFANVNSDGLLQYKGAMAHGHASECGTSVMMYLYPQLVDNYGMTRIEPILNEFPDIIQYSKLSDKTPNGTVGDATPATAEKGKAVVESCLNRMIEFIEKTEF